MAKNTDSTRKYLIKSKLRKLTTDFDANDFSIEIEDECGDMAALNLSENEAKKLRKQLSRFLALRARLKKENCG